MKIERFINYPILSEKLKGLYENELPITDKQKNRRWLFLAFVLFLFGFAQHLIWIGTVVCIGLFIYFSKKSITNNTVNATAYRLAKPQWEDIEEECKTTSIKPSCIFPTKHAVFFRIGKNNYDYIPYTEMTLVATQDTTAQSKNKRGQVIGVQKSNEITIVTKDRKEHIYSLRNTKQESVVYLANCFLAVNPDSVIWGSTNPSDTVGNSDIPFFVITVRNPADTTATQAQPMETDRIDTQSAKATLHVANTAQEAQGEALPDESGMRFCRFCGSRIPGGAIFCPKCGKKLKTIAVPDVKKQETPTKEELCKARYDEALKLAETGIEDNVHKAYDYMGGLASRDEYPPAMVWVGEYEERVFENLDNAVYWYKQAAELRDCNGARNYADMLMTGRGVDLNPIEAMKYYKIAADKGVPEAMFVMGEFSRQAGNINDALQFYKRAYKEGYEPAKLRIDQLENNKKTQQ